MSSSIRLCAVLAAAALGSALAVTAVAHDSHPDSMPLTPAPGERGEGLEELVFSPGGGWSGYRCRENNKGCPGAFVRNPDFSYQGCTKVILIHSCTGSCTRCDGSSVPGSFCVKEAHYTCHFPPPIQTVACGSTLEYDDCYFAEPAPPGEDAQTPNNCYCGGRTTYSAQICNMPTCL